MAEFETSTQFELSQDEFYQLRAKYADPVELDANFGLTPDEATYVASFTSWADFFEVRAESTVSSQVEALTIDSWQALKGKYL